MSLRVWLPLNGNNKNQGLLNINPTDLGTVSYLNDGKIGKCLSAGVSTQTANGISYDNNLVDILGTKFSCSIWVRPLGNHVHYNGTFISSGNWNSKCWSFGVNQDNTKVDIFSKNYNRYMDCTVPVNQWTHLVCTSDDGLVKLYKNGEYIGQSTQSATLDTDATNFCVGRETYASGYFSFNGNINDVRIYDHVLSLKEIRELSKGLVCHYLLNSISEDNILPNTSNKEVQYTYPSSSYKDWWTKKTSIIPTASQYILSFYAKSTVDGDKIRAHYYSPNTTTVCVSSQGITRTASDGYMDFTLSTEWKKYWVIYNQNETTSTKTVIFPRMASGQGTGIVSIKCVKFEEGNIATPWKPNINDDYYYDENIIYDTSGYGYNMTINGNPTCSTDTPRNSTCINFVSPSNAYCTKFSPTGYTDNYTVSFWAVYKANNSMAFGHSNGNRLNLYFSGGKICWNTGDGGNNTFQNNGVDISNTSYMNSWHHYVITADGTNNKLYIDGGYVGTAKTFRPLTGTTLVLSGWSADTSTSYRLGDKISDFRLYSTALSEEDIKELYNIGASIDKNGNVFAYEFKED